MAQVPAIKFGSRLADPEGKQEGPNMARDPLKKGHAVPVFTNAFRATMQELEAAVVRTKNVKHTGTKGSMRESKLAEFFKDRVPSIYNVTSGEVVDLENRSSPQLDVLIYDQTRNFPFVSDQAAVLPAEALLASIEVKSTLTAGEATKAVKAARALRQLKPFKKPLAGPDIKNASKAKRSARYYHCLFAYDTDLVEKNWPHNEYRRIISKYNKGEHCIDIVYVLGRGVINMTEGKFFGETKGEAKALTIFYFSILNFLDRESRRRDATPYSSYATKMGGDWKPVGGSS